LHAISGVYLKDPSRWPELLKYNAIPTKDPDLILPGMKLLVPVSYIKENMRAAILIVRKRDVKFRRRGETDWNDTVESMKLYFEDTIRTMEESECRVQFATKDVLKISENSLVILRPEELTQEVQLLRGKVLASKARVLTDAAVIEPRDTLEAPLFEAKIRDDKTTEVNVWKGEVNVKGGGEELVLEAGFATEIKLEAPPLTPWKLPQLPEQKIEEMTLDLKPLSVTEMALPRLESAGSFQPDAVDWEKMEGSLDAPAASPAQKKIGKVVNYRVQIAIDRTFSDIILDGAVSEAKERVRNYPDGRYYWRMAGADAEGNLGNYSAVKTFLLDRRPPAFDVIYPSQDEKISEEFLEVRGKTEFGCKAFIDGVEVIVDREG
ncbi:MAG TPA: FecR family protein, partial [bacterium]|nr:FecR family protein [bacterium]